MLVIVYKIYNIHGKKKSILWRKTSSVCYKQCVLYVVGEWILTSQYLLLKKY